MDMSHSKSGAQYQEASEDVSRIVKEVVGSLIRIPVSDGEELKGTVIVEIIRAGRKQFPAVQVVYSDYPPIPAIKGLYLHTYLLHFGNPPNPRVTLKFYEVLNELWRTLKRACAVDLIALHHEKIQEQVVNAPQMAQMKNSHP